MINNVLIGNSNTTILSATSNIAVTTIFFCNYDTTNAETITIYVVKSGDTPSNTNMIAQQKPLPSKDSYIYNTEKLLLSTGDSIVAVAGNSGRVSATVSYISM